MGRYGRFIFLGICVALLWGCAQKRPGWLDGSAEEYPAATHLTAVGIGETRQGAADRARAELAKIFSVKLVSRDTASEAAWLARLDGELAEEYRQVVQSDLVAVTDRILRGARIAQTWQDEKTKEFHALAVIDRMRMASDLRVRVDDLDREAQEQVRLGERSKSPLRRLSHYMKAMEAIDRRVPLAADLRIADPAGFVPSLPYTPAQVQGRLEEAAGEIHIGVDFEGDREGIVKGAVVQALAGIGMRLAPSWEQNLVMDGDVAVEQYKTAEPWHWSVASAQVEFREGADTLIDALRVSVREGSQVRERSRTLALEALGRQLAVQLVDRISNMGLSGR